MDRTGLVEEIFGWRERVRDGSGCPVRPAQLVYKLQRNQALRQTVARRTVAQGARHVRMTVPMTAKITERER